MWIFCLADGSHEISSFIFSEKTMKKYLLMSSAAVVIVPLRVKNWEGRQQAKAMHMY